jgi:hypothetical protein
MGATVSISPTAELVVSGRVESTDLTLTGTGSLIVPSGTTAQRPVTAENGMIRYNSTTGSVEAYTTSSGWGAISAPPSITSVSPISVQGAHTGTQTFVVQGTGINTGSTVELEGVDGNRYSVFNTTTPAAAGYQISFQMGVFGAANGYDPLQAPYKIRIANSEGVAALGTATISLDAPTITGLSNNNLLTSATGSQVITLTGTGFTSSMTGTDKVLVLGADGSTLYTVDSVTIVSSTSLTFKLSATGVVLSSAQLANKPYKVRITGIFGNTVTGTDTINLLPPTITNISPLITLASGGTEGTVGGWNEKQSILFGTASANDYFGGVVAISSDGNYGAAAALGDGGGGTDSGTVTMYKRNTATDQWSQIQTENIPSGAALDDRFGSTISLSSDGQALTIGSQLADRGGQTGAGMVSTWRFNGSTYSYVGEISNPRGNTAWAEWSSSETEKGMYMSGNGLNMIVGTKTYNSSRGIVDLYSRSAITNNWTFYGTISPTIHTHATLYFGASVAMSSDGKVVVVGAYLAQNTVYREGAAYVYEYTGSADGVYSGGSWVHRSTLLPPTPESSGHFGQKVEISGDANYVLIGEANDDVGGVANVGGAHVYVRSGNAWNFQQSLVDPDAQPSDYMGKSISINSDGTHILAGAPYDDGPTGGAVIENAGKVLHFKRTGTTWAYSATIYAPTPTANDNFGADSSTSISGDGTRALLGLKNDDTPYNDNGQLIYYTFATAAAAVIDASTQVFTVTGTGFTSSMTGADKAVVLGVDGSTEYPIDSVTIDSLTSLTFKLAASGVAIPSPQLANRPYKVKLTGNAGLTVTSTQTIGFSGISWTSPAAGATLATFSTTASANNTELDATDDVGGSGVTFSVPAANLPSGLTLNGSTGAITGIIGAVGTTSVTFRVTDNVTGTFAERTFSIVGINELYAFTSHTFTNLGASGRYGPTVNQNSYSGTGFYGNSSFFTQVSGKQGFQLWTVPRTGTYTIKAYGSSGGRRTGATNPGYGAWTQGNFSLTEGEKLVIIVGQYYNFTGDLNNGGGGGGASWVLKEDYGGSGATPSSLYLVAGGGGGATASNGGGQLRSYQHAGSSQAALVTPPGTAAAAGEYSCGGGGSYGIDGSGSGTPGPSKGLKPYNGATGGNNGYNNTVYNNKGGFGGGGGSGAHAAGGGGGYVGGRGSQYYTISPYGGSSRNNGTSITFGQHTPFEHGKVIITQN